MYCKERQHGGNAMDDVPNAREVRLEGELVPWRTSGSARGSNGEEDALKTDGSNERQKPMGIE